MRKSKIKDLWRCVVEYADKNTIKQLDEIELLEIVLKQECVKRMLRDDTIGIFTRYCGIGRATTHCTRDCQHALVACEYDTCTERFCVQSIQVCERCDEPVLACSFHNYVKCDGLGREDTFHLKCWYYHQRDTQLLDWVWKKSQDVRVWLLAIVVVILALVAFALVLGWVAESIKHSVTTINAQRAMTNAVATFTDIPEPTPTTNSNSLLYDSFKLLVDIPIVTGRITFHVARVTPWSSIFSTTAWVVSAPFKLVLD